MHSTAFEEAEAFANTLESSRELRIADIGSFDVNGCLRPVFCRQAKWQYVGIDVAKGPNVDVVVPVSGPWTTIDAESFDHAISVSTLEHTLYPWLIVQEISRIVRKGGLICLIVPYSWDYHAHPIDAWRIFPDGMRAIMELAGLRVEKLYTRAFRERPEWGDTIGIAKKV